MTYSIPPSLLAALPDDLLVRRTDPIEETARAIKLLVYVNRAGFPTFSILDIDAERVRRRLPARTSEPLNRRGGQR